MPDKSINVADQKSLERIIENIAPANPQHFYDDFARIQSKFPKIGDDLIELELLSTLIKDLETPLRIEMFNVLTVELQNLTRPSAAFNALREVKRALQELPFNSQMLLISDMVKKQKGLKLNPDLYQATRMNLEMLENR